MLEFAESMMTDPRLERIAHRVKWWSPPAETLADQDDFLCRVMNLATWDDLEYVFSKYDEDALRTALAHCRPGVIDRRSWNYWHLRLQPGDIPPLPQRIFA